MKEIELKLQIPPHRRSRLARWVGPAQIRMQASYADTPCRALAQAHMALRMRLEGDRWVQTLKGELGDGITRAEHEVAVHAEGDSVPTVDPSRHRDTPLGARLLDLLAGHDGAALACTYRTDMLRQRRVLRDRVGEVELALDTGWIEAPGRGARLPVTELELEWLRGDPAVVFNLAGALVARWGLWLDVRSKAERGDLLSRGLSASEPLWLLEGGAVCPNQQSRRARGAQGATSWPLVATAVRQAVVNSSQIASGSATAGHVQAWQGAVTVLSAFANGTLPAWTPWLAQGTGLRSSVQGAVRAVRTPAYQRTQLAWFKCSWLKSR
jgi:triphosphatase